jgi:hypothetical protein
VGVPTEQEVLKLFGQLPAELGLSSITIEGESLGSLAVYPISLSGMPAGDVAAVRKMKLAYKVEVFIEEQHLTPQTQVAAEQGETWMTYAACTHMNQRPKEFKVSSPLLSYAALKAKAAERMASVRTTMVARYEGAVAPTPPGQAAGGVAAANVSDPAATKAGGVLADDDSDDDDSDTAAPKGPPPQRVSEPTANMGMLADKPAAGGSQRGKDPKPKAGKQGKQPGTGRGRGGRKGGGKGSKKGTEPAVVGQEEDEDGVSVADLQELAVKDKDMADVAAQHESRTGKPSVCFHKLAVKNYLLNQKLGQTLVGAARRRFNFRPWMSSGLVERTDERGRGGGGTDGVAGVARV